MTENEIEAVEAICRHVSDTLRAADVEAQAPGRFPVTGDAATSGAPSDFGDWSLIAEPALPGVSGLFVERPAHYGGDANPHEAIKIIEYYGLGFHTGNAIKYILRAPLKGHYVEDLRKAVWYLQREIEQQER